MKPQVKDEITKSACDRIRMLRWICGVTKMDRVRKGHVRGSLDVARVTVKKVSMVRVCKAERGMKIMFVREY